MKAVYLVNLYFVRQVLMTRVIKERERRTVDELQREDKIWKRKIQRMGVELISLNNFIICVTLHTKTNVNGVTGANK